MVNLLTLVLVALPGLTSAWPQSTPTPWRNMYIMVQPDRPSLHRLPFGNYVCCNQPPTPPGPRYNSRGKLRSMALSLAKRGDRYAPLRRAVYEEAARLQHQRRQQHEQRAPADVIIPADIPAVPAGSEGQHFRRQSLLSRLLSMADTRPAVASLDSADARAANSRPFLMVDYPGKRSSFIAAPNAPGGANMNVWRDY